MEAPKGIKIIRAGALQPSHPQNILSQAPFLSPLELNKFARKEYQLKLVAQDCPILPVKLQDIGIKAYGPMEDAVYLKNAKIQKNVRRGNTIVEMGDGSVCMGRKGLTKFYDIKREFIRKQYRHEYGRYLKEVEKRGEQVQQTDAAIRDYTMGPLYHLTKLNAV